MKKNWFAAIAVVVFLLNGCSTPKPNSFITGSIPSEIKEPVVFHKLWDTDTAEIHKNNFKIGIHLDEPSYATLRLGNKFVPLFLMPDRNLSFKWKNKNKSDDLLFFGDLAEPNNYLNSKKKNELIDSELYRLLMEKKPINFKASLDSIMIEETKILHSYNLPETFIELELKAIDYKTANYLLEYALSSSKSYLINNKTFFSQIKELNINDSSLITQKEFIEFASNYADWLAHNEIKHQSELFPHDITLVKMQVISRHFVNGAVKNHLLYNVLNDHIKYHGLKNTELLFRTFEFQCSNTILKQKLTKPYAKYLRLNNRGLAPEVSLTTLNGELKKMSTLKGSYLFIDVWATWCTPCLRETPIFEKLKDEYAHKNIEFLSLSVDETKDKWMQYCTKHNKNRNQYWINNKNEFLDNYMIKTIPRFIIIDDKGKIIEINANRPSDNKNDWLNDVPNRVES